MSSSSKGMIGEMKFAEQCYRMELRVSKPMNDNNSYDFIIDNNVSLMKIQIKTLYSQNNTKENNEWRLDFKDKTKLQRYKKDCEYLAIYIEPHDTWYILPTEAITTKGKNISFFPNKLDSKSKWEKYRNNFNQFSKAIHDATDATNQLETNTD